MSDKKVCCICGKDMTNEFPSNPWPFGEPEEVACAECDSDYVTFVRLWLLRPWRKNGFLIEAKATMEQDGTIAISQSEKKVARLIPSNDDPDFVTWETEWEEEEKAWTR